MPTRSRAPGEDESPAALRVRRAAARLAIGGVRATLAALAGATAFAGPRGAAAEAPPASPPTAEAGPLAVLQRPGAAWQLELVHGDAPERLAPSERPTRVRCAVHPWAAPGGRTAARLACTVAGAPSAALPAFAELWLVFDGFDGGGVRQLARADADPTDLGGLRGLSFPADAPGPWQLGGVSPDGGRAEIRGRTARWRLDGVESAVWIAETVHHPPPGGPRPGAPDRELVVFAPRRGPVLLCRIDERLRPSHWCLRDVLEGGPVRAAAAPPPRPPADPLAPAAAPRRPAPTGAADGAGPPERARPAGPRVALVARRALDPSSLTAHQVASIASAQLGRIRDCYVRALARDPSARGALQLTLSVSAVGRVDTATAHGVEPELARCAQAQVMSWRFPIPTSRYGEPRTARFALTVQMTP
jgi:hypothetical protein